MIISKILGIIFFSLKINHMWSFSLVFCKYFFTVTYFSVYTLCENQYPENRQNSESWNQLVIFEIDVTRSIRVRFEQTWSQNLSWSVFYWNQEKIFRIEQKSFVLWSIKRFTFFGTICIKIRKVMIIFICCELFLKRLCIHFTCNFSQDQSRLQLSSQYFHWIILQAAAARLQKELKHYIECIACKFLFLCCSLWFCCCWIFALVFACYYSKTIQRKHIMQRDLQFTI